MANIRIEVDQAVQHAEKYWEIDGLWTVTNAVGYLLLGAQLFWMYHHPPFWRHLFVNGIFLLFLAAYVYLVARINSLAMLWLKARITYPRTGYVALPTTTDELKHEREFHPETWVFCAVIILCPLFDSPWLAAISVIMATTVVWGITRGRFPSANVIIPGYYLSAIVLPYLTFKPLHRAGYFCIAFGLVLLFAGLIQLVSYLRQHPAARV